MTNSTLTTTIDAKTLKAALATVKRVGRSSNLPITSFVYVDATDNAATISATNLYAYIRVTLPADTTIPGRAAVNPATLASVATAKGAVTLDVNGSGTATNGVLRSAVETLPADDFPALPSCDELPVVASFDMTDAHDALEYVARSAATDGTRPILEGVLFTFSDDTVTLTSTDGFRLHRRSHKATCSENFSIVVPASTVKLLHKTVKTGAVAVRVTENGLRVWLSTDGVQIASRLIEGNFPNISAVWPKVAPNTWMLNGSELAAFLAAVKPLKPSHVRITPLDAGYSISAAGNGIMQDEGPTATIDGMGEGPHTDPLVFNYQYLVDALNGESIVTLYVGAEKHNACIVNGDALLMPMSIPGY